ncbi:MAG TPA: hypothetical protein VGZ00_07935 [Candidatus Baltobacteraceae bacterium]|nr:hypothetical protein [Candidatus Baltobacteraceae bacterium]
MTLKSLTANDIASRKDVLVAMAAATGSLLLDPIRQLVGVIPSSIEEIQPHRVGVDEVADLEEMVRLSTKWGAQTGSRMRKAVIGGVNSAIELLEETPSGPLKTRLFEVAAQMTQGAGFMSYHARMYGVAQRYYLWAVRFSREIGNRRLAAKVIGDMSRLATDMGNHQEALELLASALYCLPIHRQGLVQAELLGFQASAQALLGDASGARRAVETSLDASANATDDLSLPIFEYLKPTFISYVATAAYTNIARLDGPRVATSHLLAQAEEHAKAALEEDDHFPAYRALDTIQLMNVRLLQGEPLEGVRLGNSVMEFASGVQSSRIINRLIKFDREVRERHPRLPEIREFQERLRIHLLNSGEKEASVVA